MSSSLDQQDAASSAPYFQPVRGTLYPDGQEYDGAIPPTASAYPDLPDSMNGENGQHHFDSSDQLEGLLKVANSVAAQEAVDQALNSTSLPYTDNLDTTQQNVNKRKHDSTTPDAPDIQQDRQPKRQKQNPGNIPSPSTTTPNDNHPTSPPPPPSPRPLPYTDPRPPGIHTTAAIFRRPPNPNPNPSSTSFSSTTSGTSPSTTTATTTTTAPKKSTRPPISKLFTSLELAPPRFLQLQSAAKAYMLDPGHRERQEECVGNRGKGDSDVVKLRLYNCVREFLEGEVEDGDGDGGGEHGEEGGGGGGEDGVRGEVARRISRGKAFFGEDVKREDGGERKWIWPRDRERVVGLCIPLLRRMVTNERQRRYAVETRSQAKIDGGVKEKAHDDDNNNFAGPRSGEISDEASKESFPTYHVYIQDSTVMSLLRPRIDIRDTEPLTFETVIANVQQSLEAPTEATLDAIQGQSEASHMLQQEAQRALAVENGTSEKPHAGLFDVFVQTSAGLKAVEGQEQWMTMVEDVLRCPWFENEVKVIVRMR